MLYGLGVMDHAKGYFDTLITQVIQPRLKYGKQKIFTHEHDHESIVQFYNSTLDALAEGDKPNAPATPGSWCIWCLAKNECKERVNKPTKGDSKDFDFE
jgi:hypothetical protein